MTTDTPQPELLHITRICSNGHRHYSEPSKRALVEHYLQHQATTALAQMAQQHGIDTNLLRKWVRQYGPQPQPVAAPARDFVALSIAAASSAGPSVRAHLPNGVQLELHPQLSGPQLAQWLHQLHALPCSASTPA